MEALSLERRYLKGRFRALGVQEKLATHVGAELPQDLPHYCDAKEVGARGGVDGHLSKVVSRAATVSVGGRNTQLSM